MIRDMKDYTEGEGQGLHLSGVLLGRGQAAQEDPPGAHSHLKNPARHPEKSKCPTQLKALYLEMKLKRRSRKMLLSSAGPSPAR